MLLNHAHPAAIDAVGDLTDDVRPTDPLWGEVASAVPPTSFAEWRQAADEHFEKTAGLAQAFLADLDGADALTVIEALHGIAGSDRDNVRDAFERFVVKRW